MATTQTISGTIIDILHRKMYQGTVHFNEGSITRLERGQPTITSTPNGPYILPGFVDAHVHVESSMLTPCQFARLAVVHGTVATVSDPHEIGNVLGAAGVKYMIENGKKVPFKFCFGAPSCVPATTFETAGATISASDIESLFQEYPEVGYLAEMMNFPGVLNQDAEVMEKIALAAKYNKPVDGHAPGLRGEQARAYIAAGISTDHECFTAEEALDKLAFGMKILIREGSAARNFEALADLLNDHFDKMMFCSDDKHPDGLVEGHINQLVKRALAKGIDLFKILQAACVNPVHHYQLPVGLLQTGDPADFIVVDNLTDFTVLQTYVNGQLVAEKGQSFIPNLPSEIVNRFQTSIKTPEQFQVQAEGHTIRLIEVLDGQLITHQAHAPAKIVGNLAVSDVAKDVLKMVVVNRYAEAPVAIAFIRNVGLQRGAIASSVAHDSHNIIAVGVDDTAICQAVNLIIHAKGGISAVDSGMEAILPLPIAGIMSGEDGYQVATQYAQLDALAKKLGSTLQSPFMSLSFMALLVIPSLKLSDLGLFDGEKFGFTSVFVD